MRNIWNLVREVIKECLDYQRNKFNRYKLYRKLQLVEVLSKLQEVILQDFIIKLLKLKDPVIGQVYNIILVIVDKLIKWGYFIVYIEEISVEDVVRIYIKEVFARYKALNKIILDRDPRFISVFQEIFLAE